MTRQIAGVETAAGASFKDRANSALSSLARDDRSRAVVVAVFIFAAGLMLLYEPFKQMSVGDSAGYDYMAQSILRGQMPYRDVVDIKGPGSVYLSAFAMAAGGTLGIRDIIAVRLFQALMVGAFCAVIFFVAKTYFKSLVVATVASVIPLMSYKFAEWAVVGTQPKLPMMIFAMLSLLFIAKDRPFWSGLFGSLSFICWQPGLMFVGVAFLVFSRYLTSWRDLRAVKVAAGAVAPVAAVALYFYSAGALEDLWAWTIAFNYSVFRPETQRAPVDALAHLWRVVERIYGGDVVVVLAAVAGFFLFGFERARARLKLKDRSDLFKEALLIPPGIYFGFCIINMQSGPDLIPFIPFIAIFAAWFLVRVAQFVSSRRVAAPDQSRLRWDLAVPAVALALMLFLSLGRAVAYNIPPGYTLQDQERQFEAIRDLLGPDDRIYVHGTVELLVLLKRQNINAYPFFNQGIDRFASQIVPGGFEAIFEEMRAARPKIVALSRLRTVSARDRLFAWVGEEYHKLESFTYGDVYIRKAP
jgi:hypothetical protein